MSSSSNTPRVPLYDRLPEIYRQRDLEQDPSGQLQAYLSILEDAFAAVHDNIRALYEDLFIETCDPWVVPYIGDLLGVSHLSGDPWTLRADVADTILLRRRKGTLHALELLAFDLTEWPAHCVELREVLAWCQHLNHQRPDIFSLTQAVSGTPRGGTAALRDPALLSLLGTPFDTFARTPDLKPIEFGVLRPNLPATAVYLWRLIAYQAPVSMPDARGAVTISSPPLGDAARSVHIDLEPTGKPIPLFNTAQASPSAEPPVLSKLDEVPGPIPTARLTSATPAGAPGRYITVNTYDASVSSLNSLTVTHLGLQFHLPVATFPADLWTFRGANLCAWEAGLLPPLRNREIVIDPRIGRVVFGVETDAEANALLDDLLVTWTYGTPGPVGAQPIPSEYPAGWVDGVIEKRTVRFRDDPLGLQHALNNLDAATGPVEIEIDDSMTHSLDLSPVAGVATENGIVTLRLKFPLLIRASSGNRPVIRLATPLAFRPVQVLAGGGETQDQVDAAVANLKVRLEGLYINGDNLAAGTPLVARAALHRLEVANCTLDPGSILQLSGTRSAAVPGMSLDARFGFADDAEFEAFKVLPQIVMYRSISGPLLMESSYGLNLQQCIIDAGAGVDEDATSRFAISSAADTANQYGPVFSFSAVTLFGRTRTRSACGSGGIFCHALQVENNQVGCIQFSYFSAESNQLPQNYACITGAELRFTAECFNQSGYAQLAFDSDQRIRESGPNDDAMGAYGFLLEAHKWRNLQIRFREFIPAGVRAEILPVT